MVCSPKAVALGSALVLLLNSCSPEFTNTANPPPATALSARNASTTPPLPSPIAPTTAPASPTTFASFSPTATDPALACRLISQFPVDGTKYEPRTEFSVRWDVTNTGTASWEPGDVELAYTGGTQMYYNPVIPLAQSVAPGQNTTLIVDMKALRNTSSYVTTWALRRGAAYFCRLSLKIYVQWYQGLERNE